MALALFQFFSTYGVFEELISDPGSDLTSEVVKHLTDWYGIRHVFSLVDRHESNGVKGTNKSILRHLRAIVSNERLKDRWSDPSVLNFVQYVLNSQVSYETGTVPFHAHFGTKDSTYFKLPEPVTEASNTQEFIRLLDENLRVIWELSKKHQTEVKNKRANDSDPNRQNKYQPGDFVLFQRNPLAPAPSKLSLRYMGPYEVLSQDKNDVTCRHLCIKSVHTFHVESTLSASRCSMETELKLSASHFLIMTSLKLMRLNTGEETQLFALPWSSISATKTETNAGLPGQKISLSLSLMKISVVPTHRYFL